MKKQRKAETLDHENPEWSVQDFQRAKKFDALPESLQQKLRGRGAQKTPTKERITIRLSREVLAYFRATGDGWQTRMDVAMRDYIAAHPLRARKNK